MNEAHWSFCVSHNPPCVLFAGHAPTHKRIAPRLSLRLQPLHACLAMLLLIESRDRLQNAVSHSRARQFSVWGPQDVEEKRPQITARSSHKNQRIVASKSQVGRWQSVDMQPSVSPHRYSNRWLASVDAPPYQSLRGQLGSNRSFKQVAHNLLCPSHMN